MARCASTSMWKPMASPRGIVAGASGRLGGGRYGGTLSDAEGPLVAQITGNCLHLRYSAKGHLSVEQWLYLQPGGKVALNRMVVRKFGIRVARLDETIRRVDQIE
jgi:Protein of unknown function (DUF3833)